MGRSGNRLHSRHAYGNPFTDVNVKAVFKKGGQTVKVEGFYDGNSTWKVRLMPNETGTWSFTTLSKDSQLNGYNFNRVDPPTFPFVRKDDGSFDFDRFDPSLTLKSVFRN